MHPDEVAQNFNVSRSNVIKWVQQKEKLIDAAKSEYKNHFKIRRTTKYVNLYKALKKKFRDCRAKAYCISFAWLWFRARTICREQLGDDSAIAKHHHVIVNFIKRYNLQMRKKQRSKNVSKENMRAKMLEWHSVLRERRTRTGKQDDYDEKWGRFRPECRLNADQSPCPFVFDSNRTYHHSLQKISIMRKCGYHNQVQDLIRGSAPYKFVSVLKANNLHLEKCFVELENAYQKMNVLPGTKMFTCFLKTMRG